MSEVVLYIFVLNLFLKCPTAYLYIFSILGSCPCVIVVIASVLFRLCKYFMRRCVLRRSLYYLHVGSFSGLYITEWQSSMNLLFYATCVSDLAECNLTCLTSSYMCCVFCCCLCYMLGIVTHVWGGWCMERECWSPIWAKPQIIIPFVQNVRTPFNF